MPGLSCIKILGHLKFASYGLKLPVDWKQPSGDPDAPQYGDSIPASEKVAVPTVIPPFFTPHNAHKYHQDSCNKIGQAMKDFHDKAVDGVMFAHNMWKLQAGFQNLKVMAVCAIGSPGCLKGPSLEPLIKNAPMLAPMMGNEGKYRDAVAKGVSDCFKKWQDNVAVPGLPWYPADAAFPGPMAPPVPNIPIPLIACVSGQMTQITMPNMLKDAMVGALDGGLKNDDPDKQHVALFDSIATVLSMAFMIWLASQQVMLVMGMGPIPTFAPPYVPVGPVMNGQNLPGMHLVA